MLFATTGWSDDVSSRLLNELSPQQKKAETKKPRPTSELENSLIPDISDLTDSYGGQANDKKDVYGSAETLPKSDLPLTLNNQVNHFLNYFQTTGRRGFSRWLSRSERYIPMMKDALKKEGLPEDLVYLAMIESGFTNHARSVANAVGPWQFMSGTGKHYDLKINEWIDERKDPVKSTVAAATYLKALYTMFNNNWYLATAGYNAGENKILRAINMYDTRDFWEISKGSYLKKETKDYVPKLLAATIIAKDPEKYGFADLAYLPAMDLDTVTVPTRTDLGLIAKLIDVSYMTLKDLNPELLKQCTPPDYPDYQLKLPKGKGDVFIAKVLSLPANERFTELATYKVQKHDTLASIAAKFNTTTEKLAEINNIKPSATLKNKTLSVPTVPANSVVAVAQNSEANKEETTKGQLDDILYYSIKDGDTLASISEKFNITPSTLSSLNNINAQTALKPGQRIIITKNLRRDNS